LKFTRTPTQDARQKERASHQGVRAEAETEKGDRAQDGAQAQYAIQGETTSQSRHRHCGSDRSQSEGSKQEAVSRGGGLQHIPREQREKRPNRRSAKVEGDRTDNRGLQARRMKQVSESARISATTSSLSQDVRTGFFQNANAQNGRNDAALAKPESGARCSDDQPSRAGPTAGLR
jgi:hypothetical protein